MKTSKIIRQTAALVAFVFVLGSSFTSCQRGYGCPGDITAAPVEQPADHYCYEDLQLEG